MDADKVHLRLLLNDIHVDLGIFLGENNNQHTYFSQDKSMRISDFKERLSNLENANNKYQLDFITHDIEKFVAKMQANTDFSPENKQEIAQLRNGLDVNGENIIQLIFGR